MLRIGSNKYSAFLKVNQGKFKVYESSFTPNNEALSLLRNGKIIDESEFGPDMVERVVSTLAREESNFSTGYEVQLFAQKLGERMDDGRIIMSTPIMTNAGRYFDRPLGACTMPTSDLAQCDPDMLRIEVDTLHQQGMGTGFDLNSLEDPVSMLKMLNGFALEGSKREEENRPVGNMAVLSVYHPRIMDFISSKTGSTDGHNQWKFNISVDLDDGFFDHLDNGTEIELLDGSRVRAAQVFEEICEAATKCADPGLVFLDRMNARNPVPGIGRYKTTAPCAEVGLVEGESCQFGYINAGKFIKNCAGNPAINYSDLEETVKILTRALDNALSISIDRYFTPQSAYVMRQKRKIGIGLSGVADAISIAGLGYGSEEARGLIADMLSFINYASKLTSIDLAQRRGPALSMLRPTGNRYYDNRDYLSSLYGNLESTGSVDRLDWIRLGKIIKESRMLRNTTTIALPPTGRSALVYGASTGIEPHFSHDRVSVDVRQKIAQHIGRTIGKSIHVDEIGEYAHYPGINTYLACARDIDPSDHLAMVSSLQEYTDEAISKTINMPSDSSAKDVAKIYREAYRAGTSGITIYVDESHALQPVTLSER